MKKEKIVDEKKLKNPTKTEPEQEVQVKEKSPKKTKVGAMLKEMRLQKDLKLVDIAKRLCIRRIYLEAIEDSDYKELPPIPYGIGFIRSYANFLGLNGENIVELYKEETNTAEAKEKIKVLEPQPEASMPSFQYLLISLLAIILIYLGWSTMAQKNALQLQENTLDNATAAAQEEEAVDNMVVVESINFNENTTQNDDTTLAEEIANTDNLVTVSEQSYEAPVPEEDNEDIAPETKKEESKTEQPQEDDSKISENGVYIEILEETWVEVKDSSKLYISKVLNKGDVYKVPEGKGMILSFGKSNGANVYINGKLTKIVKPEKKTNIALDPFLESNH